MIATGIVTLLDILKQVSIKEIMEKINNIIFESGISYAYKKRDLDKYDHLVESLKESLDITGYSLGAFFDSYSLILKEKCNLNPAMRVRILIIDPESEFSKNRATLEGNTLGTYKPQIERLENGFKGIENIKIKKIVTPLTTMFFKIDDTLFVGPHLYGKPSKSTLTIELSSKGWLFREYSSEFERLWTDAIDL